ncbi:MAG: hypothetical protein WD716_13400 [Fimbriimonadaceae bacterium]
MSDLPPWHANFDTEATATGTTLNLTAGQVTQIGEDATTVQMVVNYVDAVEAFRQEVTAFKDAVLAGDPLQPMPTAPVAPATLVPGIAALPGIEERTRGLVATIKGAGSYTTAIGEAYGIIGSGVTLVTPGLKAAAVPGTSHVTLRIAKGGYSVIAIDMRRSGGDWTQIGVSQTATFTDTTAALSAGQPEQREYRAQGMVQNARVGDLSTVVSVVTVP